MGSSSHVNRAASILLRPCTLPLFVAEQDPAAVADEEWKATCESVARFIGEWAIFVCREKNVLEPYSCFNGEESVDVRV